jgi:hypothetical protein
VCDYLPHFASFHCVFVVCSWRAVAIFCWRQPLAPLYGLTLGWLQIDEISTRFASSAPAMQMLGREVALMTKKLESLLQR